MYISLLAALGTQVCDIKYHHDVGVRRRFHPRGGQTVSIDPSARKNSIARHLCDDYDATCQGLQRSQYCCTPGVLE